jgi:Protein of unknown function (DUF2441)
MIDLFHVAPQDELTAGHGVRTRAPAHLPGLQREILELLIPGGCVTPWGEAMLADPEHWLHIGDRGLIDFGLASVPGGADGEREMLVSAAGRTAMNQTVDRVLELIYELVRQLAFADRPSRLTCLFAYRAYDAADEYRQLRRDPATHEIWRLQVPDGTPILDADATWLAVAQNPLALLLGARSYWSGKPHPERLANMDRETLVVADAVHVVERITAAG